MGTKKVQLRRTGCPARLPHPLLLHTDIDILWTPKQKRPPSIGGRWSSLATPLPCGVRHIRCQTPTRAGSFACPPLGAQARIPQLPEAGGRPTLSDSLPCSALEVVKSNRLTFQPYPIRNPPVKATGRFSTGHGTRSQNSRKHLRNSPGVTIGAGKKARAFGVRKCLVFSVTR